MGGNAVLRSRGSKGGCRSPRGNHVIGSTDAFLPFALPEGGHGAADPAATPGAAGEEEQGRCSPSRPRRSRRTHRVPSADGDTKHAHRCKSCRDLSLAAHKRNGGTAGKLSHIWIRDGLFATSHTRRSPSLPSLPSPPLRRRRAAPRPLPSPGRKPSPRAPSPPCLRPWTPTGHAARQEGPAPCQGRARLADPLPEGQTRRLSSSLEGLAANTAPAHRHGPTSSGPAGSACATTHQRQRRLRGLPQPSPASPSSRLSFLHQRWKRRALLSQMSAVPS